MARPTVEGLEMSCISPSYFITRICEGCQFVLVLDRSTNVKSPMHGAIPALESVKMPVSMDKIPQTGN